MRDYGFTDVRVSPFGGLAIREVATDIGRYAGFIPSWRQTLSGTDRLRTGMKYPVQATAIYRAMIRQGYTPPGAASGRSGPAESSAPRPHQFSSAVSGSMVRWTWSSRNLNSRHLLG